VRDTAHHRHFDPGRVLMCTRPPDGRRFTWNGTMRTRPRSAGNQAQPACFRMAGVLGGRALSRCEREVLRQAAAFGMTFGLAVPIPMRAATSGSSASPSAAYRGDLP